MYHGSQFRGIHHHGGEVLVAGPEAAGYTAFSQEAESNKAGTQLTLSLLYSPGPQVMCYPS